MGHMDAGTRIALVPAMGRFVIDLGIIQLAGLNPMSMEGWSMADHAAARQWAAGPLDLVGAGPPPPKIATYLSEVREKCNHGALGCPHPDLAPEAVAKVWTITQPGDQP